MSHQIRGVDLEAAESEPLDLVRWLGVTVPVVLRYNGAAIRCRRGMDRFSEGTRGGSRAVLCRLGRRPAIRETRTLALATSARFRTPWLSVSDGMIPIRRAGHVAQQEGPGTLMSAWSTEVGGLMPRAAIDPSSLALPDAIDTRIFSPLRPTTRVDLRFSVEPKDIGALHDVTRRAIE